VAKNKDGQPLKSKVEALDDRASDTPICCPRAGSVDKDSVATMTGKGAVRGDQEWQAIMDHLATCRLSTRATCRSSRWMTVPTKCGQSKLAEKNSAK